MKKYNNSKPQLVSLKVQANCYICMHDINVFMSRHMQRSTFIYLQYTIKCCVKISART